MLSHDHGRLQAQAHYFGKLPSRGDFVRSTGEPTLIHALDGWMSQTLLLMREDKQWHVAYDAAAPVNFAILGAHCHAGLAGHLVASRDAAGRRFPFVLAASFELQAPKAFLPHSPLALNPLWCKLGSQVKLAQAAEDFAHVQGQLVSQPLDVPVREEGIAFFLQQFDVARFESVVSPPGAPLCLRQTLLALGWLLRPVLDRGPAGLEKGLVLPLPHDPMPRPHVLTWWVDLVARFFKHTATEMALFVTTQGEQPVLVVGFHGASPNTLRSVIDPAISRDHNINVAQAEWVEDALQWDDGMRQLSQRLRDPRLSLEAVSTLFSETFLGVKGAPPRAAWPESRRVSRVDEKWC